MCVCVCVCMSMQVVKCIEKVLEEYIYQLFMLDTSREEWGIEKTERKWKIAVFFLHWEFPSEIIEYIKPGNFFNDFKNGRGFVILNAQKISSTGCFITLLIILDTKTFKNPQTRINILEINK